MNILKLIRLAKKHKPTPEQIKKYQEAMRKEEERQNKVSEQKRPTREFMERKYTI